MNDIVCPFEKSLLVQFRKTGKLRHINMLQIDQGITFNQSNNTIKARYHFGTSETFIVESFSSEKLANTAFCNLQTALKHYAYSQRFARYWKTSIKWIFVPLMVSIFAFKTDLVGTEGRHRSATNESNPSREALMVQKPTEQIARERGQLLAYGARSGKYAVQLSNGTKGIFYVFSDPSCLHCQHLESELHRLAKDYTIYIFPVTLIGGEVSSHRVAKLMCSKSETRAVLWKKIVEGEDLANEECSEGIDVVARNNQMFDAMGLLGTPTIINESGEQMPNSVSNTAETIHSWIKTKSIERK
ncbi:MAG: Isomerase [Candidatus Tokpelaia sp. JSC188]|nr:MAG: Isomerase [Candidatus Tokpelaia sp. JSC188]